MLHILRAARALVGFLIGGLAPTIRVTDLEIERATRAFTTQEYRTNFLIMTAMAETVYTHSLEKRGRERAAARIEHVARCLYPALLLIGLFVIVARGLAGR